MMGRDILRSLLARNDPRRDFLLRLTKQVVLVRDDTTLSKKLAKE